MSNTNSIRSIEFYGRHAEIIEKVSVTNDSKLDYNNPPIFNRVLDSMYIAGLIGLIYKRKSNIDTKTSSFKKTIFNETVYANISDVNFYTAIPIIKDRDLSKISEMKTALFTEGDENYFQKRLDVFYQYVLGGLEIIEERVINEQFITDEVEIFDKLEELIEDLVDRMKKIDPNSINIDMDLDFDAAVIGE